MAASSFGPGDDDPTAVSAATLRAQLNAAIKRCRLGCISPGGPLYQLGLLLDAQTENTNKALERTHRALVWMWVAIAGCPVAFVLGGLAILGLLRCHK
jgi:hypothetical protein